MSVTRPYLLTPSPCSEVEDKVGAGACPAFSPSADPKYLGDDRRSSVLRKTAQSSVTIPRHISESAVFRCNNPNRSLKQFGGCKPDDRKQHLASAASSAGAPGRSRLPSPLDGKYEAVYSVSPSASAIPSSTSSKEKRWQVTRTRARARVGPSSPHFSGPARDPCRRRAGEAAAARQAQASRKRQPRTSC
jgi:hypothetical protein